MAKKLSEGTKEHLNCISRIIYSDTITQDRGKELSHQLKILIQNKDINPKKYYSDKLEQYALEENWCFLDLLYHLDHRCCFDLLEWSLKNKQYPVDYEPLFTAICMECFFGIECIFSNKEVMDKCIKRGELTKGLLYLVDGADDNDIDLICYLVGLLTLNGHYNLLFEESVDVWGEKKIVMDEIKRVKNFWSEKEVFKCF